MSYLSPKLQAMVEKWRMSMHIYGSATLNQAELDSAIIEEAALRAQARKEAFDTPAKRATDSER